MAQLKHTLKLAISLVVRACDATIEAVRKVLRCPPRGRCVVLYYHAVPADQRSLFSRQMDVLLELATPLPSGPAPLLERGRRYVMVTFDDGFLSVKENALPELRHRQIPSTIFVPSGCLGQNPAWLRHARSETAAERVMTAEELRELTREPLVTIGSHTVAHVHLGEVSAERAQRELFESKAQLEAALGRPVEHFSYPFGGRNSRLDAAAAQAGYRRLFSSEPSCTSGSADAFVSGRISVDPDISPLEFRLKVLGAYRWGSWLQAAKTRLRGQGRPRNPNAESHALPHSAQA